MSDQETSGGRPVRPRTAGRRWTSFVADAGDAGVVRSLHEDANPAHRARVEHDQHTLLVHVSGEDGEGWTTIAIDRPTRQWAVAQERRQADAARAAYDALYG